MKHLEEPTQTNILSIQREAAKPAEQGTSSNATKARSNPKQERRVAMDGDSLSPDELRKRWGCSLMTVKRRIKQGRIRAQKNGRLVRIALSEIIRFENEITN